MISANTTGELGVRSIAQAPWDVASRLQPSSSKNAAMMPKAVAASLLYDVLGLYRIQLVVVSVMAALVLIYVIASLGYWGRVATVSTRNA